jgi:hypothetical protein
MIIVTTESVSGYNITEHLGSVIGNTIRARHLGKDIMKAPGIKNKLMYPIMPPGWNHTGEHKTAKSIRSNYLTLQSD